ncbi:hypothetical protein EYF80_063821 [Liparis tanakae]|uniref:Uncharacterized protein n=1 Tax=Liparis tanakae TaxID=230148 RepID=A0A4Z2EBW5_9TELE|nr:hypothetical protein EYF80_063821 [Liparis tanakae]
MLADWASGPGGASRKLFHLEAVYSAEIKRRTTHRYTTRNFFRPSFRHCSFDKTAMPLRLRRDSGGRVFVRTSVTMAPLARPDVAVALLQPRLL